MKTNIFKRITLAVVALMAVTAIADAQDNQSSSATLTRRNVGDRDRKKSTDVDGPQVTDRMQAFYEDAGGNISDADREWMRVIYREIDLDNDKNAALYFPEDLADGQENLFRIIMRLLANGQIKAYEFLDGREDFSDENIVEVGEMLDRFDIYHTEAKGSTSRAPRFAIHPADVPTNEVLTYYVIERWEYDNRTNKTRTVVEAICPVLHRTGDFGGEAIRYPMFWIKFKDIRPWLAQQPIFTDDNNNLPSSTYDDFFTQTMYVGDIYKTRNLRNKSMAQLYPDADQRKAAQDSIQAQLTSYGKNRWVPDREEVIASAAKKKKSKEIAEAKVQDEDSDAMDGASTDVEEAIKEEKAAKRTTKRTTKKSAPKSTVKETKVKSSSSSNATRSVRKRK